MPLSIVCWKWKPLPGVVSTKKRVEYIAEDVNRLYEMLCRHLHIPFSLLCVTDDPIGIYLDVKIVPLWDELRYKGGCFVRLVAFRKDIGHVFGPRFVSMDLDCVIVDDITPLFNRQEDFIIWGNHGGRTQYCGSLLMMNAGCRSHVYEQFDPEYYRINSQTGRYGPGGTDQQHISNILSNETTWAKADGVRAYRNLIKQPVIPSGTRIVFFNGVNHPREKKVQGVYPWIRFHYGPPS